MWYIIYYLLFIIEMETLQRQMFFSVLFITLFQVLAHVKFLVNTCWINKGCTLKDKY